MTDDAGLVPGLTAEASLTVGEADTAIFLGSGDVAVLGTPRVVALAEEATVAAVTAHLSAGLTTVGARVEIDHLRPSRVGDRVVASARLEQVDGRQLVFSVEVADVASGRALAQVRVVRAVVDRERFA